MSEKPRFTIQMTIRDNYGVDSWHHAIGCDDAMKISNREVDDLKMGPDLGVSLISFDAAVRILKTKELRRDILMMAAKQLAAGLADRLEDSEGWHDPSRIEPAKRALANPRP